jgi:hypothetical protein
VAARFHVRGTFHLTGRDRFVVYGDVLEAEVRAGMRLQVPLNSQLSFEALVTAVEFVDGTPTGSHVALVLPLDEPLDLRTWQSLNVGDEVLEVRDPGPVDRLTSR